MNSGSYLPERNVNLADEICRRGRNARFLFTREECKLPMPNVSRGCEVIGSYLPERNVNVVPDGAIVFVKETFLFTREECKPECCAPESGSTQTVPIYQRGM